MWSSLRVRRRRCFRARAHADPFGLDYRGRVPPTVLHLSTYAGNGGAGRAAVSLHRAMLAQGIDSRFRSARGPAFTVANHLDRSLWHLQRSPWLTWRSPARFGSLSAREINASDADIVNLHWVTDGFLSIEEIGRITKPLVWTMHDMWPFTGTEHYAAERTSGGPARWEAGYLRENRPTDEHGPDIDRWAWQRKRTHWGRPANLVPVSRWLADLAARSALADGWPSRVIPNVMPIDRFTPMDRDEARRGLGLPTDTPLIAFTSSAGIGDTRKGWPHLRDAVRIARQRVPELGVIVIGPNEREAEPGIDGVLWQGQIDSDDEMALRLAAADAVAVPSESDNLPMTACEAQACGRSVVAFRVGGLPDIVDHQASGYLAQPFDADDLAEGLVQSVHDARGQQRWSAQARVNAESRWSPTVVVDQYLALYERVLS